MLVYDVLVLVRPAAPHASEPDDSGRGSCDTRMGVGVCVCMCVCVCVCDAFVLKYIIFSHIVMSYKLHPT